MPTPSYLGTGQPPADNGGSWFGQLGSLFGRGNTPAYAGDGQPSASGASVLGAAVPAYAPAPVRQPVQVAEDDGAEEAIDACGSMSCPIDLEALAAGQIAIVIPRQGI